MKRLMMIVVLLISAVAYGGDKLKVEEPDPEAKTLQVSPAQLMEIITAYKELQVQQQKTQAERDYWYRQYKKRTAKDGVCI